MILLAVALGVTFLCTAFYFTTGLYSLGRLKSTVDKEWHNIETFIESREEEVGKVIRIAEKHMQKDSASLKKLAEAKSLSARAETMAHRAEAYGALTASLAGFFQALSKHPKLESDSEITRIRDQFTSIDAKVFKGREQYRNAVQKYNAKLKKYSFPKIATMIGHQGRESFELDADERTDVSIRIKRTAR